jgi:PilZ domain-containing protein
MRPLGDRRIRLRFEVVGTLHGTLELSEPARVLNLSAGGALIRTPLALPVGSAQTIHLNLGGRTTRVTGLVKRLTPMEVEGGRGAYSVGLEFVSPSPALAASLEELLEAQGE